MSTPIMFYKSRRVSPEEAKEMVENFLLDRYGVDVLQLHTKGRGKWEVDARRRAYYLLKTMFGLSYPEIGRIYDRDHSTVIYNFEQVGSLMNVEALKSSFHTFVSGRYPHIHSPSSSRS